ncbi:MAG: hypothetical protein IKF99_08520 [Oscillospiraceae bacterium]|nr:hypothetical protein [Oscillospiraceae bacterium]
MTEKDKIIQDLRRDNDRLHVLIEQYIEGVNNYQAELKALREENATLKAELIARTEAAHEQ